MIMNFLKPLKTICVVFLITCLGIASDIAQLTNINIFNYIVEHAPQSYCFILITMLILYIILVIREFLKKRKSTNKPEPVQSVMAKNISHSTIVQSIKGKED